MALKTCQIHNLTYNDRLDPSCPQCALQGIFVEGSQVAATPGKAGAPAAEEA